MTWCSVVHLDHLQGSLLKLPVVCVLESDVRFPIPSHTQESFRRGSWIWSREPNAQGRPNLNFESFCQTKHCSTGIISG